MTYSEIHKKINLIIYKKMRVNNLPISYTANFFDDYGFSEWELNWLLINVEDQFNIRLKKGLERELSTINELVALIHSERQRQYTLLQA